MTNNGITKFSNVTELNGQMISREQLLRMVNRYQWAAQYTQDQNVLELACGGGQGLSLLSQNAQSVRGSDIDPEIVKIARQNNPDNIIVDNFEVDNIPFADGSFDVVILFEAIYYLPNISKAIDEISRVLTRDGYFLIATANPELYDFSPSPHANKYYSKRELQRILEPSFSDLKFFGFIDVANVSLRQKLLRPMKAVISKLGLLPKDMRSKEILKRIFFGRLLPMPTSLTDDIFEFEPPDELGIHEVGDKHKVIYSVGRKKVENTVF